MQEVRAKGVQASNVGKVRTDSARSVLQGAPSREKIRHELRAGLHAVWKSKKPVTDIELCLYLLLRLPVASVISL